MQWQDRRAQAFICDRTHSCLPARAMGLLRCSSPTSRGIRKEPETRDHPDVSGWSLARENWVSLKMRSKIIMMSHQSVRCLSASYVVPDRYLWRHISQGRSPAPRCRHAVLSRWLLIFEVLESIMMTEHGGARAAGRRHRGRRRLLLHFARPETPRNRTKRRPPSRTSAARCNRTSVNAHPEL